MISAFRREAESSELPIIFDGHSVIDGRDGLLEIPASVFAALGLNAICYLTADPQTIFSRRLADPTRIRPERDAETLAAHQMTAQAVAQRIAYEIKCPFFIINDESSDRLITLIT
jgi:adenylate kinase